MANSTRYTLAFRRQREGRTNYKQRLGMLKSGIPRLVVRRTNRNIVAQVATYDPSGDKIIISAHSRELSGFGYTLGQSNISASYLVGLLVGTRISAAKIPLVIADFGLQRVTHKGNLYAFLKGVRDAKVPIPVREDFFPDEKRISGAHIEAYAKAAGNATKAGSDNALFSKTGQDAQKATATFAKAKEAIIRAAGTSPSPSAKKTRSPGTHQ